MDPLNAVRSLVSKKKRRYTKSGFDLDLTYITDRIIAMGYPADGVESLYRNPMAQVQKFLESQHPGHYKVYNLCSERSYPPEKFNNNVACYPFDDHNPPPLSMMKPFCEDVKQWLDAHPLNVAVVHCKAGKGRTGTMIAAYLVYSGVAKSTSEALAYFAERRTRNGKGVTIPSQIRYVRYFESLISPEFDQRRRLTVWKLLRIETNHMVPLKNGFMPFFSVLRQGKTVYFTKKVDSTVTENSPCLSFDCEGIPVNGDVKIEFFHKTSTNRLFWFWFNTAFIPEGPMTFHKTVIDKAAKDTKCKVFKPNFRVTLYFQKVTGAQQRPGTYALVGNPRRSAPVQPTRNKLLQTRPSPSPSSPVAYIRRNRPLSPPRANPEASLQDQQQNSAQNASSSTVTPTSATTPATSTTTITPTATLQLDSSPSTTASEMVCSVCKGTVEDYTDCIVENSKFIHWRCIKCVSCGNPLSSSDGAIKDNVTGGYKCSQCDAGFFSRCAFCNAYITDDSFATLRGIGHICHLCFQCSICGHMYTRPDHDEYEDEETLGFQVIGKALVCLHHSDFTKKLVQQEQNISEPLPPPTPVEVRNESIIDEDDESAWLPPSTDEATPQVEDIPEAARAASPPPQRPSGSPSSSAAPAATTPDKFCKICGEGILDSSYFVSSKHAEEYFHSRCFKCERCKQPLSANVPFYRDGDFLLCEKDWKEIHLPTCIKCHTKISDEKFMTIEEGDSVHLSCFKCEYCSNGLETNFYIKNGRWCCTSCAKV